jgi:SAM-dependent methyltransferase
MKNVNNLIKSIDIISKIDFWYLKQYFSGHVSLFQYYQKIFVKEFGKYCTGDVIEIGANKLYKFDQYFPNANKYQMTNIEGDYDMLLDATNMMTISDNSIDAIICTSVLEHIFEYNKAMSEIERILKPGGKLLLVIPYGFPIHDTVDYWRFGADYFYKRLDNYKLHSLTSLGGKLSTIVNAFQRPCGKLTKRYILYKIIGILIAIIAVRLDEKDTFPLGYGIFAEKK